MTTENYNVSIMSSKEVQIAIDWAAEEGWNPGLQDAKCFYQANPQGMFIGKLGNQAIACASAMKYDNQLAHFGLYLVKKEFRHQGYGFQVTQARLAYVSGCNIGLDGVIEMADIYGRIGFVTQFRNHRYIVQPSSSSITANNIVAVNKVNFDDLVNYDAAIFSALRKQFLKAWISAETHHAVAYVKNNKLLGYGVIRQCVQNYKIGPLFADSLEVAIDITEALMTKIKNNFAFIDIPEINLQTKILIDHFNMRFADFACERMYTKGLPTADFAKVYGITTLELG